MSIPYKVQSAQNTKPISAKGLNDNFEYLETKSNGGGFDVPAPPVDQGIWVLACRGGYLFWMETEECE